MRPFKIILRPNGSKRVLSIQDPDHRSPTQQQFKDEADPNVLMKKYRYSQLPSPQGIYLDTTSLPDLKSALDTVRDANTLFSSLPSDVPYRFKNDPQEMITFVEDPKNKEECIKLGLFKPLPVVVDKMDTLIDVVKSAQRQNTPSKKSNQKNDPDDL